MDLDGSLCGGLGLLFATLAAFGGLALATLTLACGAVVGAVRTALSRPAAVTLVAGRRLELVVGTSVSAGLASRCAGAAATAWTWTPSGGHGLDHYIDETGHRGGGNLLITEAVGESVELCSLVLLPPQFLGR
ncbi:MAG: hypothetical protein WCC38_07650 [Pseudonocardiaceae bacterium]